LNAWTNLYETWYFYHGTWAHFNGVLHISLPPVCMCIPLSLLDNCSVKPLPRQRIQTQKLNNCWMRRFLCGPCFIKGKCKICSSQNFSLILVLPTQAFPGSWNKAVTLPVFKKGNITSVSNYRPIAIRNALCKVF
jgi:hypothetical protein